MDKTQYLKYYFWVFGVLNVFIISFTIPLVFGDFFLWHPRNIPDEMMIGVLYLAMGIVMILVANNPTAHKAFLDFLIVANTLHALVMMLYARNVYHVLVDAFTIGAMGVVPLFIYPWGLRKLLRYEKV